jgi:hypothetical protein
MNYGKYLKLSDSRIAEMIASRKDSVINTSESYYIGYLMGTTISKKLPELRYGQYQITIAEADKLKLVESEWYGEKDEELKTKKFDEYLSYLNQLEVKYLPHTMTLYLPIVYPRNWEDFKKGIRNALWDSDTCNYKIDTNDDFIVEMEDDWYSMKFTFTLKINQ